MAFASVEAIETEYEAAIKRAGDNLQIVSDLRVERAQALAEFKLRQVAEREKEIWRRDALHDFPLAKSFPQLITGQTEEEIRKSAEELHAQLEGLFSEHQKQQRIAEIVKAQLEAPPNGETKEVTQEDTTDVTA
jgi:hypothetical protein